MKTETWNIPLMTILLLSLLVSGCSGGHSGSFDGPVRIFWTWNFRNEIQVPVTARLMATGEHCLVYVQSGKEDQIGTDGAGALALEFDNDIYGLVRGNFGGEPDIDGNGKVIILVLDIEDDYGISGHDGSYYAGYFNASDLFTGSTSNRADMFYMDCFPGTVGDSTFYNTLAHEFQHMIHFNQKVLVQGSPLQSETWIDEGLSSAAEHLYGGMVTQKVEYWNNDPLEYIALGTSFLSWSGFLENYATVYLFFRWVGSHASNGSGIYKEMLDNANTDYRMVLEPVRARIGTLTSAGWGDVLVSWYIANLLQNPVAPYGYGADPGFTLTTPWFSNTGYYTPGETWNLYAGEAVYLNLGNIPATVTVTGGGAHILYAGIDTGTGAIDRNGADGYTGTVLIACNASTVPADPENGSNDYEQTGLLPSVSVFTTRGTRNRTMPDKMPIDALPGRETRF